MSRRRAGSAVSDKQLAYAVRDGKLLTIEGPAGTKAGYLAGWDDYHWFIVTPSAETVLVHKTGSFVTIARESSLVNEDRHEEIDNLTAPFGKSDTIKDILDRGSSSSSGDRHGSATSAQHR